MVEKIAGLKVTTVLSSSITVNWTKPDEGGQHRPIGEYFIIWSPPHDGSGIMFVNASTANVTGLISNQQYHVAVGASVHESMVGEASDQEEAITCKLNSCNFKNSEC